MSSVRNKGAAITLDKERRLLFTLNAMAEVEERFGSVDKIYTLQDDGSKFSANLRWFYTLLLNSGREDGEDALTEEQVGRLIHAGNYNEMSKAVSQAVSFGFGGGDTAADGEAEDGDEDDDEGEGGVKNQ
jgi:hypothetical protein